MIVWESGCTSVLVQPHVDEQEQVLVLQSNVYRYSDIQMSTDISKIFGFLTELTSSSNEKIEEKAKNIVSSYPDDLKDTLAAELIQFPAFVLTQKPVSVNESAELTTQAFVIAESVSDVSKRIDIALRIYLCMMVSNASGERSFSKLGRVGGDLQSSMGQERLSMLTLMSIEHELLRCLDFTTRLKNSRLLRLTKQQ